MARDPQDQAAINRLASRLANLEAELAAVKRAGGTPQLTNASITGGAIKHIDSSGTLRGTIGTQPDGTFAVVAANGAPPPRPSTPALSPCIAGLMVTWDGLFAEEDDGDPATQPADFAYVQVHLSTDADFTPDATTLRGSLAKPGGLACTPLTAGTAYYAVLVGVNTSGVTGEASAAVSGVPQAVVDGVGPGEITETLIADDAITTPKLRTGAVDADKLAANSVTAGAIQTGALDALNIHAGTLTLDATSGDMLVYDGPAAAGNLFGSWSPTGGVDPYGNGFPAGLALFNNGQLVGADVVVTPSTGSFVMYKQ